MSVFRRPTSAIALAAALVLVALAAAGPASAKPLKIALEGPLSGSQASTGKEMLRGVRLAVRQENKHGGVVKRKVKIVKVDDKGDQSNAKQAARRAIKSHVKAVIGPYNSSVGIVNLPIYLKHKIVPVHLTSSDDTEGEGVTIQPKNSQIAPLEDAYIQGVGAKKVTMLVDDTANGAFTVGMADRLQQRLEAAGVTVTRISVKELQDPGVDPNTYYAQQVATALATSPDLIYSSTYFPEGAKIAQALQAAGSTPPCLMGLANVDRGFIDSAGLAASQRCVFSGVPEAPQLPTATKFVSQYENEFNKTPGVWGVFTYDSAKLLFAKMRKVGGTKFKKVQKKLRHTKGFSGQTGEISIDPQTGYRTDLPFLHILTVDPQQNFVIAP